jgi:hypothetical protein
MAVGPASIHSLHVRVSRVSDRDLQGGGVQLGRPQLRRGARRGAEVSAELRGATLITSPHTSSRPAAVPPRPRGPPAVRAHVCGLDGARRLGPRVRSQGRPRNAPRPWSPRRFSRPAHPAVVGHEGLACRVGLPSPPAPRQGRRKGVSQQVPVAIQRQQPSAVGSGVEHLEHAERRPRCGAPTGRSGRRGRVRGRLRSGGPAGAEQQRQEERQQDLRTLRAVRTPGVGLGHSVGPRALASRASQGLACRCRVCVTL